MEIVVFAIEFIVLLSFFRLGDIRDGVKKLESLLEEINSKLDDKE